MDHSVRSTVSQTNVNDNACSKYQMLVYKNTFMKLLTKLWVKALKLLKR